MAQLREFLVREDGRLELDEVAAFRDGPQQIPLGTDAGLRGRDDFLADAIDRRVGDLGEELLEIVVQQDCGWFESTARGVSLPIEPTASTPSRAIGTSNRRNSSNV